MKKIKLDSSRLKLAKEKIANLSDHEMNQLRGGDGGQTEGPLCVTGAEMCPPAPETNLTPCTNYTQVGCPTPTDNCSTPVMCNTFVGVC